MSNLTDTAEFGVDYLDIDAVISRWNGLGTVDPETWDDEERTFVEAVKEMEDQLGDLSHYAGEHAIRDDQFEDYAQQLAEDIGAISENATWPNNCIDWQKATRELKYDYTEFDVAGYTYQVRA